MILAKIRCTRKISALQYDIQFDTDNDSSTRRDETRLVTMSSAVRVTLDTEVPGGVPAGRRL